MDPLLENPDSLTDSEKDDLYESVLAAFAVIEQSAPQELSDDVDLLVPWSVNFFETLHDYDWDFEAVYLAETDLDLFEVDDEIDAAGDRVDAYTDAHC